MQVLSRRSVLAALAALPLLARPGPASAQFTNQRLGRGPLLGVWATAGAGEDPQRPKPGEVGISFRIDGLYQKRTGVAAGSPGYVEVIGSWHWDQKSSELTWTPEEWSPKSGPAPEAIGKRSKVKVEIVDKDNVVLQLPGGPLRLRKLF